MKSEDGYNRQNIMKLAWPAMMRLVFQTLTGIVTLIIIGRLGKESIAAVGMANRVIFLVIGTFSSLTVGTTAIVAHYIGAGDQEGAKKTLCQSLILSLPIGVVLMFAGMLWSDDAIALLMFTKPDAVVIKLGGLYLQYVIYSMLLGLPMMMINAALQGAGDMKTPMYLLIGVNSVNLIWGIILVYGLGPFPRLELKGAAIASALSNVIGGIATLLWIRRKNAAISIHRLTKSRRESYHDDAIKNNWFRPSWDAIKQILDISIPASGEQLVQQSGLIIYTMLIVGLGTVVIAANQITMNIQSLSMMVGFGFSLAATTLVGQSLGAKKPDLASKYGKECTFIGTVLMGIMGVVIFAFSSPLARLYTTEADVSRLATICVRINAFAQIPFSIVMVLSGALRGAGDTRYVMYITIVGQWCIRLLLAYILGFVLGYGLPGVWIAMLIDVIVRSVLVWLRYKRGRWMELIKFESIKT